MYNTHFTLIPNDNLLVKRKNLIRKKAVNSENSLNRFWIALE